MRRSRTATVPVGAFALSESGGPAGYTPSPWSCVGGTSGTNMVTLAPGDQATCTIVNTAVIPTLTLVKVVDNGTTGATTLATAWTLSASGPVSISGATGSTAVTAAPVQVGQYTLAETGPTGYAASDWVCTGGGVIDADVGDAHRGPERDLHDHQHGDRPDAHAGEGRQQPLGRHGRADRLDPQRASARRR